MISVSRYSTALLAGTALLTLATVARAEYVIDLDTLTVLATKNEEKAIDALAGVSVVDSDILDSIQPTNLQQVFSSVPGLWVNSRSDDPGVGFNVRGMQDFGRVAVIVDGARQNFQVAQHGPQGKVYLDPELISDAEVVRGPVSNIYGSGAIGGVVSMRTKDVEDILNDGQSYGVQVKGLAGTNQGPLLGSIFFGARPNEDVDLMVGGTWRTLNDYFDADGNLIENTWSETATGLAKLTVRPAEGHEIKLGAIIQHNTFDTGDPGNPDEVWDGGTDYGNTVDSKTITGKYSYDAPDSELIDFVLSGFWNNTVQKTVVKEQYATCSFWDGDPFNPMGPPFGDPLQCPMEFTGNQLMDFTGPVGTESGYDLTTWGFDTHNASRFDAFGLQNTLTIGGDYFKDDMVASGTNSEPDADFNMTGSGTRAAYGAFAQWLAEYGSWLDVIGAVRWDGYKLEGMGHESEGSRLSPKVTVGVTPTEGFTFYGTYAEGYRAPTVVEAFASGQHPGKIFLFLPNPALKPEIGQTYELGVNLKYDNVLNEGDALRFKANIFRNNLTDYIGLEDVSLVEDCPFMDGPYGPICYQYVNIPNARIQGLEGQITYDAGTWFAMASGSIMDGKDLDTGENLIEVLKGRAYASVGIRFLDRKLTIAPTWQYGSGGSWVTDEGDEVVYDPYNLFGLSVGYQANENVLATLVVENLFNTQYTTYFENNPSPGFSVKAGLQVRIGAN
jgi:hemoglobin/transferrin/lactoferrin receptor protein